MNTQSFSTESSLWINFKKSMYALMVIIAVMAVPVLGYLELSHNKKTVETTVEKKIIANSGLTENTTRL